MGSESSSMRLRQPWRMSRSSGDRALRGHMEREDTANTHNGQLASASSVPDVIANNDLDNLLKRAKQ